MIVESNHSFAIALLSDWLKSFAPVLQPTRSKTKIIAPFAPVVIGQLSLRYWFFDSYLKASLLADFKYNSKTIFFVGLPETAVKSSLNFQSILFLTYIRFM